MMSLEEELIWFASSENWQGAIEIFSKFDSSERSKFLWAWPTVESLQFLHLILEANNVNAILSIGCGSGLLEWIIEKALSIQVVGLELDNSWWKSVYAPHTFVRLEFAGERSVTDDFFRSCFNKNTPEFALLFCYFNDHAAFLNYVRAFNGDVIIIVGPQSGENIVTDPLPLHPQFQTNDWALIGQTKMQGNENCLAVYKRMGKL